MTWGDTFENIVCIYRWLVCEKTTEWINECLPSRYCNMCFYVFCMIAILLLWNAKTKLLFVESYFRWHWV